jgi:hypothetical protein
MSGRPYLRKLEKHVKDNGGDQWILDRLASGESVGRVAASITLDGYDVPVSRPFLYAWRDHGGEDRREGWRLAMVASGSAHAEKAGDVLEDMSETADRVELGRAKALSEYHRWMARVRDREQFGEEKAAVQITLTAGELHLDALRAKGHMDRVRQPEQVQDADYKVLEAGDGM